ncbi:chemotaxis protein R [Marivirga tractuosa]|uniref:MCP methyltransferase, CheR-type n=1 Tax=Marivirga tractuosa (strain ATCC 23168 / DSM 4126 / NBRC 15989 / NCIMB 1408 / VKM B-1430 / H-43) TaxID=643867 RepID=E4TQK7_MARTH|nr:protein-glutamate O-methyltransferase CheR [Marivirga tractuosa]ADR23700.1 MCP methyltransferase, CheR-type [Marivirga tractuosa DSM 4126]BDD15619.1 chemotaxis protein R [Marivirga tractuosa]
MNRQDIEISDLRRITELVKEQYRYDFTNYAMSSFRRRILRIMELYKFGSADLLIKRLKDDKSFFDEFIAEITVNVTEMFRDPPFWRELRDNVIPNILLNHNTISIWHAGCSSGEEVFSMAILLKEMGILDKAKIIATDIDKVILEKAKKGHYSMKNMELNEKNYIRFEGKNNFKDYFKEENGKAVMEKSLIQNVSFREHDLVQGVVFNKFDLILCRNVMIYFNQNLQNEVLKKHHESLFKYGYLVIGSKESLIWCEIANKFIVVNNEEKIYKKIKD